MSSFENKRSNTPNDSLRDNRKIVRNLFKLLIGTVVAVIGIAIYINTNFYIVKQSWKYRDGAHIGDWIEFNKGYIYLRGKNIFRNGEQIGVIHRCTGRILIIRMPKSGESGYYINKS